MFTGIITDVGEVRAVREAADTGYVIATSYDVDGIAIGASIACAGVCLTVIEKGVRDGRGWFAVQASSETRARSTLAGWTVGTRINLERPLKLGDELGGHIVLGHVDAVARLAERRPEGQSLRLLVSVPEAYAGAIAPKGSVALDGVSLTVNEVEGVRFGVNIIPHTQAETTLGAAVIGDALNLEIDPLARYVARLIGRELP